MVIACWSVKGGSGTTVVATGIALRLARDASRAAGASPVVLADLAGDVPAVLGRPDPTGAGLREWLGVGPDVAPDALDRLTVDAAPGLALLPAGALQEGAPSHSADGERFVHSLAAMTHGAAVVDCGSSANELALGVAAAATRSLLVVRPCFLALRRAVALSFRPSAVVLIEEPGRTLSAADVEDVLDTPVITVPWHPEVARAVDAGLLAARVPRALDRALRGAA